MNTHTHTLYAIYIAPSPAVLVVVDVSNKYHRQQLPSEVTRTLQVCTHVPRALVLNKVRGEATVVHLHTYTFPVHT